ncbi:MAG: hypothetical protein HC845_16030 [Akkermansiaceae bacterium]|nr:hypothetical protein [Akkermansiaceae bacterium]
MISLCWYKVCIVWHYRVPVTIANQIGILPSLEVLPFFWDGFKELGDVHFAARSSYGRIMREMLGGSLAGGILPWEIFVSDIFARPNQRNRWVVPLFVQAYPTELVLKESISRAIHQAKRGSPIKLPAQLVIGVESMNSLTKRQFYDWLGQFKFYRLPK